MTAWILEQCPKKSGSKYNVQYCLSHVLYRDYRAAVANGKLLWAGREDTSKPRCRTIFDRLKKAAKVRTSRTFFGQFHCMRCGAIKAEKRALAALEARLAALDPKKPLAGDDLTLVLDISNATARVRDLEAHQKLRHHQHAYLMQCRHDTIESDRDRVLVVMDFSKFNLRQNVTATTEQKEGKPETVHDMIMVLEYWPKDAPNTGEEAKGPVEEKEEKVGGRRSRKKKKKLEPKRREVRYIDNLTRDAGLEGNDTEYVRMAMRNSITAGHFDGFSRVDLFTDGGPKHYKSVYGMRMMSQWAEWWAELRTGAAVPLLYWNFTAPNHGHGVADSHAGIFSQMLTRKQNAGQHGGGPEAVGGGPSNVDEVSQLMEKMKKTTVVTFDRIEQHQQQHQQQQQH